jgi:hypothetical protein
MAEAGFQWIFSVEPQDGARSYYSGLALATTVAGAVVIVPAPLSAPAISLSLAPPALQEVPRDSLDPTWRRTQFAELGPLIGTVS